MIEAEAPSTTAAQFATTAAVRGACDAVAMLAETVIGYTSGSTALPEAVIHTQLDVTRHPPDHQVLLELHEPGEMLADRIGRKPIK
jgi:acyl-coenzyme A synthetase/AMP-(fatty) acid ligase